MKIASTLSLLYAAAIAGALTIATVLYLSWDEFALFEETQKSAMQKSVRAAHGSVGKLIAGQALLVEAFAGEHGELLQATVENSTNLAKQVQLMQLVGAYFPEHLNYAVRSSKGEIYLGKPEPDARESCLVDMASHADFLIENASPSQAAYKSALRYRPALHSVPDSHFCTMASWRTDEGGNGLLMISFPPEPLVRTLEAHEVFGHQLLLLRTEPDNLIEVTSRGTRENIQREGFLSPEELQTLFVRLPVEGSRWDIAYLPAASVFEEETLKVVRFAASILALVLVLIGVFAWWHFASERVRRKIHKENMGLLQQSVSDRTALKTLVDLVPVPIFQTIRGQFVVVNSAYARLIGSTVNAIQGKTMEDIFGSVASGELLEIDEDLLARPGTTKIYERHLKPLGEQTGRDVIVYKTSMQTDHDDTPSIVGAVIDMTEEKALKKKLEVLAMTDHLTGIANRRKFFDALRSEYQRHVRYGHTLSIVMLDIDHFKEVNDTYGHEFGDEVIKVIANTLENSIREDIDLAARVGGEEFALLLPETNGEGALVATERIRKRIENRPIAHNGDKVNVTISAGIAVMLRDEAALEPDALINNADKALYDSKNNGRNQTTIYKAE